MFFPFNFAIMQFAQIFQKLSEFIQVSNTEKKKKKLGF
jgi:hypothetical protein